jgi:DNA-binding GntR family transcriptional regulator
MRSKILFKADSLAKEIEFRIRAFRYPVGSRLPSERSLAEEFQVHRETVKHALDILLWKNLIRIKPQSGAYVSRGPIRIDFKKYKSMKQTLEDQHRGGSVKLLDFQHIHLLDDIASRLLLPLDTEAWLVTRLRYLGNTAFQVDRSYILCDVIPRLKAEDIESDSLYRVLRKDYGIRLSHTVQKVRVEQASNFEAEVMNIAPHSVLMCHEGMTYDSRGRLIEFFTNFCLPKYILFVQNTSFAGAKDCER